MYKKKWRMLNHLFHRFQILHAPTFQSNLVQSFKMCNAETEDVGIMILSPAQVTHVFR